MKRNRIDAGYWTMTDEGGNVFYVRQIEPKLWQAVDSRGSWVTTCRTLNEVEEYLEVYR